MPPVRALLAHRLAKPLLWLLCLLPLLWLLSRTALHQLGANPAEALIRASGDWTLRSLCLVLALTPLRVLTRTPVLARFRRMLGLFVFFYALLHALSYSGFDMGFDFGDIARDIVKRPFILVGFGALLGLSLLALTSFNRAIQWLGARRWRLLHKLVYGIAALALLHFFWMRAGKNNVTEVFVYAALIATLLGWRVWNAGYGPLRRKRGLAAR